MATYNGAAYIRQQLDSLASQVLQPGELVVTDDGSSDGTVALVDEFAHRAPFPVKLVRNEARLGYRGNFIKNTTICGCDLIAFCDQDDVWHPEKLQEVSKAFDNPEVLLCYHNARLIDKGGAVTGRADIAKVGPLNPPSSIHPYTWGLGFLLTFRKSLVGFADLWPGSVDTIEPHNPMAHDMWIYFLSSVFGHIAYMDVDLVDYRQHGQNTVGFQWGREGRWKRLKSKVAIGADEYDRLAKVSRSRQHILETASTRLDGAWLERAKASSALYRQYAAMFEERSKIYSEPGVGTRLKAFQHLIRRGAYGSNNTWGFSYESLLKDALMVVSYNALSRPDAPAR